MPSDCNMQDKHRIEPDEDQQEGQGRGVFDAALSHVHREDQAESLSTREGEIHAVAEGGCVASVVHDAGAATAGAVATEAATVEAAAISTRDEYAALEDTEEVSASLGEDKEPKDEQS